MSLKTVHLVFVVCTVGLSIFIAIWNYYNWINYGEFLSLIYLVICIVSGLGIIFYGKKFLSKFKELSFM